MTDRTELRRQLDEYPKTVGLQNVTNAWFELARAAVSALPGLLDQLDAAEAALARVREDSYPTQQDAADESGCDCPEDPESTYLAHTPECLATITHFDVCSECARIEYADAERQAHGEFSGYAESLWPCPTIAAIGGGE